MAYLKYILWVVLLTVFVDAKEPEGEIETSFTPSNYSFSFETENGQVRDENIEVDTESNPSGTSSDKDGEVNVKGSYSFISADGYEYSVYYKAGKNGYQPYVTAHKIKTDTK